MRTIDNIYKYLNILKRTVNKSTENEYFFRGHANKEWEILPTIYRKPPNPNYISNEDKIFREIIRKAPHEFINENSTIEKLVKMQHYGIPTRLFDITSNALIALYFACNEVDNGEYDGEIICFEIPKKRIKFYDSDQVSMLSNLAKMPIDQKIEKKYLSYKDWVHSNEFRMLLWDYDRIREKADFDRAQIEKEKENYFQQSIRYDIFGKKKEISNFNYDIEVKQQKYNGDFIRFFNSSEFAKILLHQIKDEKPQFHSRMNPFDFHDIVPVKVKQSNARIIKQSGAFLLFGMKNGDKSCPPDINHLEYVEDLTIKINKIRIKGGDIKRSIIKELETLGITQSTLFPEIEHQAAVVKKLYS